VNFSLNLERKKTPIFSIKKRAVLFKGKLIVQNSSRIMDWPIKMLVFTRYMEEREM